MKVRFLGHSCVEIVGRHHILIDPDFTNEPLSGVEYICITHAHSDHIGRVAEVSDGIILASPDVCEVAMKLGVSCERLHPVRVGDQVANIRVLPGYSSTNEIIYTIIVLLFLHRKPESAGTPLSFFIDDDASLYHNGDAYKAPLNVTPDILCLPWRNVPFRSNQYKETLVQMTKQINPRYVLPIHHDLQGREADLSEVTEKINVPVLNGYRWYCFYDKEHVS